MRAIKNYRIIDFLWENGCKPEYEYSGFCYYRTGKRFQELMERYYIQYQLFSNRWG